MDQTAVVTDGQFEALAGKRDGMAEFGVGLDSFGVTFTKARNGKKAEKYDSAAPAEGEAKKSLL